MDIEQDRLTVTIDGRCVDCKEIKIKEYRCELKNGYGATSIKRHYILKNPLKDIDGTQIYEIEDSLGAKCKVYVNIKKTMLIEV